MTKSQQNISDSWDRSLYCYGTAYILQYKIKWISILNTIIKFIGLAIPLVIGGVVISFGYEKNLMPVLLIILGVLSIIQLVVSLWALVDGWDKKIEIYTESKLKNAELSDLFKDVAQRYDQDKEKYENIFNELMIKDNIQRTSDNKIHFSDKEKRKGLRAGLYQFQRKCLSCNQIPKSLKASNCEICGNF